MTDDRIVYSAVAVPNEADYDGEILTAEEIRYAAHHYMGDHRIVDLEHTCAFGSCKSVGNPVESYITTEPMAVKGYDGSNIDLPSGTWIIGIEVFDDNVLQQIQNGEKRGVSLTAKKADGVTKSKVLIRDLGSNWVARTVSIVRDPAVPKARFFKSDIMSENIEDKDAIETGFDKVVSAIKSLRQENVQDDAEDLPADDQQESEDVAEVEETIKSTEEIVEDEEVAEDPVSFVTHDELAATKSEILDAIKSLKPPASTDKDERIEKLEKEIESLKTRLTSVKSKAIADHYADAAASADVTKSYDINDRDLYGRVIRK